MSTDTLLAALGGMSIIVAIEGTWVYMRVLSETIRRQISLPLIRTTLNALYAIGLPYFALVSGLLPAHFLGLRGWDELSGALAPQPIPQFISQLLLGFGNAFFLWLPDFGAIVSTFSLLGGFLLLLWGMSARLRQPKAIVPAPSALITLFDVVHWGFYRAILWSILGSLYLAALGGMVIIALEWIAVAHVGKFDSSTQQRYSLRFGLGVMGTVAFIFAPNLWLVGIAQWVVWQALFALEQFRQPRIPKQTP